MFIISPSFSRNRQKRRRRDERIEIKNIRKNHLPTSELRGRGNYGRFPFGSKTKFSRNLSRDLPSSPIFHVEFGRLGLLSLTKGRSAYPKRRRKACPTLPANKPPARAPDKGKTHRDRRAKTRLACRQTKARTGSTKKSAGYAMDAGCDHQPDMALLTSTRWWVPSARVSTRMWRA